MVNSKNALCENMKFENLNIDSSREMDDSVTKKNIYTAVTECAVSLSKNYILQLAATKDDDYTIAVGLSNDPCSIYKLNNNGLSKISSISCHDEPITDLKFDKNDNNLLYSSSVDGTIKQWDLRDTRQSCKTYQGQKSLKTPLLSFDIDLSSRILCAGTEHTDGDSFLLFWDSRSSNLLGGYWESHDDDIIQIHFHSSNRNLMMSGSTDGLINIFDISQPSEDDSLQYTYNTMSSVQKLNWFSTEKNCENVSCITDTNDLQLWNVENCSKIAEFERSNITKYTERIKCDDCYLINTHITKDLDVLILTGSNADDSDCLEALSYVNGNLQHEISFPNNKQIIRNSWFDNETAMFIMGGESGVLSVFKSKNEDFCETKSENKATNKKKERTKFKPY